MALSWLHKEELFLSKKNCGTSDSLYQDQNPLQNITGDSLVLHTMKVFNLLQITIANL